MVRITNPSPYTLALGSEIPRPFPFRCLLEPPKGQSGRAPPLPCRGCALRSNPSRGWSWEARGRSSSAVKAGLTSASPISSPSSGGRNLSGDADDSDQLAALDFLLRLSDPWGAELYGEWGGEDEAGGFFSNMAYTGGIYLPRLDRSERLSLRFEYSDLSHIDDNSPPWYHHGIYRSGYTYEEKILGHPAGGTSRDAYGELRALLPDGVTASLALDYQSRGSNQPVKEKHLQPALGLDWQLRGDPWSLPAIL